MGEMAYEDFPRVSVPLVYDWFSPAFDGLNRVLWGRRGVLIVWGLFFWVWGFWCFVKAVVWIGGITVLFVAFLVWTVAELATYKTRQKRATRDAWIRHMKAVDANT